METEKPKYLTHTEAANFLKVKPSSLYVKVNKGHIKHYKFRGSSKNLYLLSDLEELLELVEVGR